MLGAGGGVPHVVLVGTGVGFFGSKTLNKGHAQGPLLLECLMPGWSGGDTPRGLAS